MKKKKEIKKSLLLLLIIMGIGFASVATILYVTGTASISNADFEIIFTKAIVDGDDISDTAISEDGKEITYTTSDLKSAGDTSVLNFTVKNNSPMYDATVSINCTTNGENNEYYTVSELIDGKKTTTIESMHTKDGEVTVTLSQVSTETISEQFTCTINVSAEERTTVGEAPSTTLNFDPNTRFRPMHFEFGVVTIDSPITPPENRTVFMGMDEDGNKGVCTLINDVIHCFQGSNNDAEIISYEQSHLQSLANNCYDDSYITYGDMICALIEHQAGVESTGRVWIFDSTNGQNCDVDFPNNNLECFW